MANLTLEQLSLFLKEQRGNRGIRTVAGEIGISAATLSRVESGRQPDLDTFSKICRWLGVDPGSILGFSVTNTALAPTGAPNVYAHFRAEKLMKPETAQHLGSLILAIQHAMVDEH